MNETRLHIKNGLPFDQTWSSSGVLFYDQILAKKVPGFYLWKQRFFYAVELKGGENIKSLTTLTKLAEKLLVPLSGKGRELTFVACGGGSVTDMVGFLASIYRRGVALTLIPSTWLAAVDSAHGGKNAVNLAQIKNQIGTFYFPSHVFLSRKILSSQSDARLTDVMGEVAKTYLLTNKTHWRHSNFAPKNHTQLWQALPKLVAAKWKIIRRDPLEKKGLRHLLNLGHTWGHVIESKFRLSHGQAVAEGLFFALDMSQAKGLLSNKNHAQIESELIKRFNLQRTKHVLSKKVFLKFLLADKKMSKKPSFIRFIFIRAVGRPKVEMLSVQQLTLWAKEYGWIK